MATPSCRRSPAGLEPALFGLGCFWGAERKFWHAEGVYTTALGYAAGSTTNPTYEEVCSGLTGHAEVPNSNRQRSAPRGLPGGAHARAARPHHDGNSPRTITSSTWRRIRAGIAGSGGCGGAHQICGVTGGREDVVGGVTLVSRWKTEGCEALD